MTANVAFENNETGAYIEGVFIADTGPTWMVKPETKETVIVLQKSEWASVRVRRSDPFGDIFSMFGR